MNINIRKCKIRKCMLLKNVLQDILQYKIYSPLPLNKTAQRNSQHCVKVYSKVDNVFRHEIYRKIEFFCFGFVKKAKSKVYILN